MMSPSETLCSLRAIIVDDEPLARKHIARMLGRHADIVVIETCGDGRNALELIRDKRPDLLFLDVEMPEFDGFDILESLGSDLPKATVFVTAYDRYAVKAFEAGALDYLLKPFDDARFDRMLDRCRERIASTAGIKSQRKIPVKTSEGMLFIRPNDIDWVEAADYYSCLHVRGKEYLLRRSIADLEAELLGDGMCRIHRSLLVNVDRVIGLRLNKRGDYEVALLGGTRLRLSRRYRRVLLDRIPTVD